MKAVEKVVAAKAKAGAGGSGGGGGGPPGEGGIVYKASLFTRLARLKVLFAMHIDELRRA